MPAAAICQGTSSSPAFCSGSNVRPSESVSVSPSRLSTRISKNQTSVWPIRIGAASDDGHRRDARALAATSRLRSRYSGRMASISSQLPRAKSLGEGRLAREHRQLDLGRARPPRPASDLGGAVGKREPDEPVRAQRQRVGLVANLGESASGQAPRRARCPRTPSGPAARTARTATGWPPPGSARPHIHG